MPPTYVLVRTGLGLINLYDDVRSWSEETFGPASARGPAGPLRHLALEAAEAVTSPDRDDRLVEMADCLILLCDALWRDGRDPTDVLRAAAAKMVQNRARAWPPPSADDPCEHLEG